MRKFFCVVLYLECAVDIFKVALREIHLESPTKKSTYDVLIRRRKKKNLFLASNDAFLGKLSGIE